jgi:hypothetical protein
MDPTTTRVRSGLGAVRPYSISAPEDKPYQERVDGVRVGGS